MQMNNQHITFLFNRQNLSLLLTVTAACLLYKLLDLHLLKHSAALFIGIPVFMSIALSFTPGIKHVTRHILIGMGFGLLASFVYLKEGSFCVPMTAPLFLLTGLVAGFSFNKFRQLNNSRPLYLLPIVFLLTLSIEGTSSAFSLDRHDSVQIIKQTNLTADQVLARLSENRQIRQMPPLLSWGFPQPALISGSGINIGDVRDVYFSGGEGEPGHTVFQIVGRTNNSITFSLLKDESHIGHWLNWKSSTVSWIKTGNDQTQISWSVDYERKLDPSWYFGPLQNYAVKLAAEALIDNLIVLE